MCYTVVKKKIQLKMPLYIKIYFGELFMNNLWFPSIHVISLILCSIGKTNHFTVGYCLVFFFQKKKNVTISKVFPKKKEVKNDAKIIH